GSGETCGVRDRVEARPPRPAPRRGRVPSGTAGRGRGGPRGGGRVALRRRVRSSARRPKGRGDQGKSPRGPARRWRTGRRPDRLRRGGALLRAGGGARRRPHGQGGDAGTGRIDGPYRGEGGGRHAALYRRDRAFREGGAIP